MFRMVGLVEWHEKGMTRRLPWLGMSMSACRVVCACVMALLVARLALIERLIE